MDLKEKIKSLCSFNNEKEWFEFKENWFDANKLGEYISALSNSAVYNGEKEAYFIWGINDLTHEIVGTNFNYNQNYKNEPLENFLARNLNPSIRFKFEEFEIDKKRIVVLIIPSAKDIPVSFKEKRYIRIGSSKVNLSKYPQREKYLFKVLEDGISTIENTPSEYQDLTFNKLFGYYGSKGIVLKENTFKKNLGLLTKNGKYNILAQLLSDNSRLPLRIAFFQGTSKSDELRNIEELGYDCLLYSLDTLLRYSKVLNIKQADEKHRVVERIEIPLFDESSFKEAIINAILHNKWLDGNEPMISVYHDRLEILSRGSLAPNQTIDGFFRGESIPVNTKLSEIFLQLHISEKSGRGVPTIVKNYGREAFDFRENSIVVTIPFNWLDGKDPFFFKKVKDRFEKLNNTRKKIVAEIRKKPNITKRELKEIVGGSSTSIDNNISFLRKNNYIERIGSNKTGHWKIIDKK